MIPARCVKTCALAIAGGMLLFATAADATTWVRGRGTILPGGLVDPLIIVGPGTPTVSTGQFNDGQKGFFSQADIGNGALRGSAYVNAINGGGFGSAGANPIMGESVHFNNTTGATSSWDFSYDIEGVINTVGELIETGVDSNGNPFNRFGVGGSVHIFAGGTVGPFGSADSWVGKLDQALFTQTLTLLPTELDDLDDLSLSGSIAGSLDLAPGMNDFDIVLLLTIVGNITSGNPAASFDFDFANTATFGIDSPVAFTSDSGVFLTGENRLADVPVPATLPLLAAGLALFATYRRRAV